MDAQTWSAIAVVFSACSSIPINLTHRRSSQEAVRPELVPTGWSRIKRGSGDEYHEGVAVGAVTSVGPGPATHVMILPSEVPGSVPETGCTIARFHGLRLPCTLAAVGPSAMQ